MDINIAGGLNRGTVQGLGVVNSNISGASTGVARASSGNGASSSSTGVARSSSGNGASSSSTGHVAHMLIVVDGVNDVEARDSGGPSNPPKNTGAEPASSREGSSSDNSNPPINTNGIVISAEGGALLSGCTSQTTIDGLSVEDVEAGINPPINPNGIHQPVVDGAGLDATQGERSFWNSPITPVKVGLTLALVLAAPFFLVGYVLKTPLTQTVGRALGAVVGAGRGFASAVKGFAEILPVTNPIIFITGGFVPIALVGTLGAVGGAFKGFAGGLERTMKPNWSLEDGDWAMNWGLEDDDWPPLH